MGNIRFSLESVKSSRLPLAWAEHITSWRSFNLFFVGVQQEYNLKNVSRMSNVFCPRIVNVKLKKKHHNELVQTPQEIV